MVESCRIYSFLWMVRHSTYIKTYGLWNNNTTYVCTKIGTASVQGHEPIGQAFLAEMEAEGLTLTTIDKAFDGWEAPRASATAEVVPNQEFNGDFGKTQDDVMVL